MSANAPAHSAVCHRRAATVERRRLCHLALASWRAERLHLDVVSTLEEQPRVRRRQRWRVGLSAVMAMALAVAGWATFVREPTRHDVNGLSCTSRSFRGTAVDFQGIPSWPSAEEALQYAFDLDKTLPTDGWELSLAADQATWERHDGDGHLVGRSVHQRVGGGWGFAMPDVCEETRTDPPTR